MNNVIRNWSSVFANSEKQGYAALISSCVRTVSCIVTSDGCTESYYGTSSSASLPVFHGPRSARYKEKGVAIGPAGSVNG